MPLPFAPHARPVKRVAPIARRRRTFGAACYAADAVPSLLASLARPERRIPAAYGLAHAVVDTTTVSVVYASIGVHALPVPAAFRLVIAYDVLAFASQALIGVVADRLRAPRAFAVAGLVIAALSLAAMPFDATSAMLLAGLGNAIFHVGGGSLALAIEPGRAGAAGVFVGPGALGLALGLAIGQREGAFPFAPIAIAIAAALVVIAIVRVPREPYAALPDGPAPRGAAAIAGLLLFSIAVRAFVGFVAPRDTPRSAALAIGLALAAFGGKTLGGLVADRLGWIATGVGALALSAPVIVLGAAHPAALVAGMALFQMTMPVTLAGLALLWPRRPALVFGVACVALVAGALAAFSPAIVEGASRAVVLALVALSAVALHAGLRRLGDRAPSAVVAGRVADAE
jgi:FSR family fosmidomycin resistance protein-like MFS transporter